MALLPSYGGNFAGVSDPQLVDFIGQLHLARAIACEERNAREYKAAHKDVAVAERVLTERLVSRFADDPGNVGSAGDEFSVWSSTTTATVIGAIERPANGLTAPWLSAASVLVGDLATGRTLGLPRRDPQKVVAALRALEVPLPQGDLRPLLRLAELDRLRLQARASVVSATYAVQAGLITAERAAENMLPGSARPTGWAQAYSGAGAPSDDSYVAELRWGAAKLIESYTPRLEHIVAMPPELLAANCRMYGAESLLERHLLFQDLKKQSGDEGSADDFAARVSAATFEPALDLAMWMSAEGITPPVQEL
jgi:hypothetical protein